MNNILFKDLKDILELSTVNIDVKDSDIEGEWELDINTKEEKSNLYIKYGDMKVVSICSASNMCDEPILDITLKE